MTNNLKVSKDFVFQILLLQVIMTNKKGFQLPPKSDQKPQLKQGSQNYSKVPKEDVFDGTEHFEFSKWVVANEDIFDRLEKGEMMTANKKKKKV